MRSDEDALKEANFDNGGQVTGADGHTFVGLPETNRKYEELMKSGVTPRPKGPKPIVGWSENAGDGAGGGGAGVGGDADGGAGVGGVGGVGAGSAVVAVGSPTPRAVDPSGRVGPTRAEDAWKWQGVPPGCGLLGPVEPGKPRFYLGYDAQGPRAVHLGPVWPPDDREDSG